MSLKSGMSPVCGLPVDFFCGRCGLHVLEVWFTSMGSDMSSVMMLVRYGGRVSKFLGHNIFGWCGGEGG